MQFGVLAVLSVSLLAACLMVWHSSCVGSAGIPISGSIRYNNKTASVAFASLAACQRPELDEAKLEDWSCKVFRKVCFDQVRSGAGWPSRC